MGMMENSFPESAMILAAGSGKRLWPITTATHKCMIEVGGKPVIQHAIERLREAGVSRVIINVCHLREQIIDFFGDGQKWGVEIVYSIEEEPLGTAGGVKRAAWFFRNKAFVVWYGDNVSDCRLDRMWALHQAKRSTFTVAFYKRSDVTQSGVAVMDGEGRILRFVEKPKKGEEPSHWVNAGIYFVEPEILSVLEEPAAFDFGKDVFPSLLVKGAAIYGYKMSSGEGLTWIDTPDDYAAATRQIG
jgi:NDP-sugar pyrophosphorylase family protein